jgi:hypothetical protein
VVPEGAADEAGLMQPSDAPRVSMVAARYSCHNVEEFIAQFCRACFTVVHRLPQRKLDES